MKKALYCALVFLLLASAALAAGPGLASKVKVTVFRGNVRSAPSSAADVILIAERDRVFDVIKKVGAWYLVALPDNKQGYLSETIVVEIGEDGKPVPAPVPAPAPAAVPAAAQHPAAEPVPPAPAPAAGPFSKIEIGLFGGYASTFKMGPANYYSEWYADLLTDVAENTDISVPAKGGLSYGGSFTYFFTPNFGVQVVAGHLSPAVATASDFTFSATWDSTAGGGTFDQSASWTGKSSLSATVFSLDAVGRFGEGSLTYSLFGGLTLFRCSFQASGTVGYGVTWEQQVGDTVSQYVDALPIPAEIPMTSWTGIGFNVGLGISYQLSSSLALSLEARYYDGGLKNLSWTFTPGSYDGMFAGTIKQLAVTADDVSYIASYTTTLPVNPSFFQITGGIKILF